MRDREILVWDLPTRVFHWLLALSFLGAYVTADGERYAVLHLMFGYSVAGLLAFRLLWGVVGTRYARFDGFPLAPAAALAYAKSLVSAAPRRFLGHNPLGSWAIVTLLALLTLVVVSGVGAQLVPGAEILEDVHEGISGVTLGMVVLHVMAVVVSSLLHRENLVRSMLTGYKRGMSWDAASAARPVVAVVLAALVAAFWSGMVPIPGLEQGADAPSALSARHHVDDDD